MALLAAVALVLTISAPGGAAGDSKEPYIVRPGDTLSGIAGKLLGDPKRWPELQEANPQITDPTVIYPGDTIVLPGSEEPEEVVVEEERDAYPPLPVASPEPAEPTPVAAEPEIPPVPVEVVKPVPIINAALYRAAGYISHELPEESIIASVDRKLSLVTGDEVYLSVIADEGAVYTVVRPTKEVYHPASGEFLGWVIKVVGWAQVTCPGETNSRAVLSGSVDAVAVGDLLLPYDPEDRLEENILKPKQSTFCLKEGEGGYIVAAQEDKLLLAEGDIIFLDQGRSAGTEPGSQFAVYQMPEPGQVNVIGQVQILRVGEKTSTALVTNSIREISVADTVQAWEAPATEEVSSGG
jgi:hypothetical protein